MVIGTARSSTRRRVTVITLLLIASSTVRPHGQSVTVHIVGDALHVRAPGPIFSFIEGSVLDRLKDGRSVRVDFTLAVAAEPGGPVVTERPHSFNLSYDLWEERFAVSRIGVPARSISHLSSTDAEAWCLQQLGIPVAALGGLGRDRPFWIRLAYRVPGLDATTDADDEPRFTLRNLIDRLSRRRQDDDLEGSLEAGPFHLR